MNHFIAGIDGGGTKTECLVFDIKGNLVGRALTGPSSLRNQGLEICAKNVAKSLKEAIGKKKGMISIFVGLAAVTEEYTGKTDLIKKELLKDKRVLRDNVIIGSDQEAAFWSGTDEPDGIVVIAGTGSVVRGWNNEKSFKVGGWGYFADEGSAFWVGSQAYQAIAKELDARGKKTIITKLSGFNNMKDLNMAVYKDPMKAIPSLSVAVNTAAEKGDRIALGILEEGTEELSLGVATVVKKLDFKKDFPLVIVGGMFQSKIFETLFREKVKRSIPFARFIIPTESPAFGALKLAMKKFCIIK